VLFFVATRFFLLISAISVHSSLRLSAILFLDDISILSEFVIQELTATQKSMIVKKYHTQRTIEVFRTIFRNFFIIYCSKTKI
jgi:hypothetical protein